MAEPLILPKDVALAAVRDARWTAPYLKADYAETQYALSVRSTAVVDAVLAGCTHKEVGEALGVSGTIVGLIMKAPGRVRRVRNLVSPRRIEERRAYRKKRQAEEEAYWLAHPVQRDAHVVAWVMHRAATEYRERQYVIEAGVMVEVKHSG